MISTFQAVKEAGIKFWDEAEPREICAVPCWPDDANGDAVDCETGAVIIGVLEPNGLFRELDPGLDPKRSKPFNPRLTMWRCGEHGK